MLIYATAYASLFLHATVLSTALNINMHLLLIFNYVCVLR